MGFRSIQHILPSSVIDMAGTSIKQALPTQNVEQISPFLLLHHFGPFQVEAGQDPFDVAPHPHRGFEPVTFLYQGGIRHKDSRGNEGHLEEGDVQWMTAGRGIIHSERASKKFLNTGGTMEGIQLWINLPQNQKMRSPRYQNLKKDSIPQWEDKDGHVRVNIVAGTWKGTPGPAQTQTPILALQIELDQGYSTEVEIPHTYNAMAYVVKGTLTSSNGFDYEAGTLLHYATDGTSVEVRAKSNSSILFLAGAPIDEPLAQWGPYVMNTQTEILEAMRDYQMGKMGFYID